jgi:glycerol kinase
MPEKVILALDQGTTSSRSIVFDAEGRVLGTAQREFRQIYPQPGWVEHDPEEIWETQRATAQEALRAADVTPDNVAAIGITNQRETTVLWERNTGRPVHNAIVWQCRRTATQCTALRDQGLEPEFRTRTGLVLDPYFSGTKLKWLLDHVPGARSRAAHGELCFGTVDSWLLFRLTGRHATDYSNASRTLLFNLHETQWDPFALEQLEIPPEVLPEVEPSAGFFGTTSEFGGQIPVTALIGDQQAALFGQAAFDPGSGKNTYGTGCFLLMNTGEKPVASRHGLLTTIAWGLGDTVTYALEGSVFVGGAVVQWLRDELKLIASAAETEALAKSVPDTHGVYLVPAFVGLGAPYWDSEARGIITGLTRGANRAHIARAALESISFQCADVVESMERDLGEPLRYLRVDGGASANDFLLQHQADVLGIPVERGIQRESTALGAAFLAGLYAGVWPSIDDLRRLWRLDRRFTPQWDEEKRRHERCAWNGAVQRARFKPQT